MIDQFNEKQASIIAIQQIDGPAISSYGVIDAVPVPGNDRLFEIRNLVEKPKREEAPSNLAIVGRYVLTPKIFDVLDQTPMGTGGELQLTDGLRLLLNEEKIYGYRYDGKRHDAGDKLGFLKATVEFALKRPELNPAFRDYLKSLKL
jgi:UTP--glucose-1-phosphate uridylyltransferase